MLSVVTRFARWPLTPVVRWVARSVRQDDLGNDSHDVADPDLFNESDFWQHPRTFERLRQGDCEDHALWARRKLVELGFDEARQEYIPHAGVDHAFHQHAYVGYLRALE